MEATKRFFMHKIMTSILMLFALSTSSFAAEQDSLQTVKIADPFIEMHTGPGTGYPVFHIMERHTTIDILYQRANWYKVRNSEGKYGWVPRHQLAKTLSLDDTPVDFSEITHEDFSSRQWESGVLVGNFGGAPVFSVYGSYQFNQGLSAEFSLSKSIGDISSSLVYKLGMVMQPFTKWDYSPFFQLSAGIIDVTTSATATANNNPTNEFASASIGLRKHLTQKIILRLEYSEYRIFSASSNNDNNEDLQEWKIGFAAFF